MHSSFLSIENLGKRFNRANILENVSFSLEKGESLLIRGKSGCGKTTLLRCIALLEPIDCGQIVLNGNIVSKPGYLDRAHRRLEIGMVFQQLYLWSHMTVLDNVALPLWLRNNRHKKQAEEIAKHQLAQLGIEDKANEYPHQLSGGQRQRAALARALVHSPQLLLLDEITANLDPETVVRVVEIVEKIIEAGTSAIWVTHSELPSTIWSYILRYDNNTWIREKYC